MFEEEEITIYEPVRPPEESRRLFAQLAERNMPLLLRNSMDRTLGLIVDSLDADGSLRTHFEKAGAIPFKPGDGLRATFRIGSSEFFFECRPRFSGTTAVVPMIGELLQLQKRKTFRLVLPDEYPAVFEIDSRFEGTVPLKTDVIDISDVGVGFRAAATERFGIGEKIEGHLRLGSHAPVRLGGWVRFLSRSAGQQQIGFEIDHGLARTADELQTAILHFRRDVFLQKK